MFHMITEASVAGLYSAISLISYSTSCREIADTLAADNLEDTSKLQSKKSKPPRFICVIISFMAIISATGLLH